MDLERVQEEFLGIAKSFTTEQDPNQILAEIRHNGGAVNLVDFTTDYNVALFFACDGSAADDREDGRIIVLQRNAFDTFEPSVPANRVTAQKSVFVVPPAGRGVIDSSQVKSILPVPSILKPNILAHLRNAHGIGLETIYNDLLGFTQVQNRYMSPTSELLAASTSHYRGDLTAAVERYSNIVGLVPWDAVARYDRGQLYLELQEYSNAIADLDVFIDYGDVIPGNFRAIAYNCRGLAKLRSGHIDDAATDLARSRELIPADFSAVVEVSLGILSLARSDWDAAEAHFRSALDDGYLQGFGFFDDYGSIQDFELKYGVSIPTHIAEMLYPPEE